MPVPVRSFFSLDLRLLTLTALHSSLLCGPLRGGQLTGDLFFLLLAGLGLEFLRLGHFFLRLFAAARL